VERRRAYHRKFLAMDKLLPPESGDFWFVLDQIHSSMEILVHERKLQMKKEKLVESSPDGSTNVSANVRVTAAKGVHTVTSSDCDDHPVNVSTNNVVGGGGGSGSKSGRNKRKKRK